MLKALKSLLNLNRGEVFIDFLGIGAQKSGTTWLYENLRQHPQVFMPDIKEIHFFDENFSKGLDWYKNLFAGQSSRKRGEITPAYAILEKEKIKFIKSLNPNLKIIYILRNPIERAFSAALMDLRRAGLKFEETPDIWFINHFKSEASLKRGDYMACAQNWLSVFPKKNFLVLNYQEIAANPSSLLTKCCQHLGIDAGFSFDNSKMVEKVFAGEAKEIRKTLKPFLEDLYIEKISLQKRFFLNEFGVTLFQ